MIPKAHGVEQRHVCLKIAFIFAKEMKILFLEISKFVILK